MNNTLIISLSWAVVLVWMILIFMLSSQPAYQSNDLSKGLTEFIVKTVEKVASKDVIDIGRLNHIARKNAHFFTYLILGVLVMNAMRRSGMSGYNVLVLSVCICVLYAISDEVHQLFVPGRGAQVKDVLIDSAGATVGVSIYSSMARMTEQ